MLYDKTQYVINTLLLHKWEIFLIVFNSWKPLTTAAKSSILQKRPLWEISWKVLLLNSKRLLNMNILRQVQWQHISIFQALRIKRINPLSANPTKGPNTLKQFVGRLTTNSLSVFDHFVKFGLKGLTFWHLPKEFVYILIRSIQGMKAVKKFSHNFQNLNSMKKISKELFFSFGFYRE